MIPAGVGALIGLCLFVRGFSQLRHPAIRKMPMRSLLETFIAMTSVTPNRDPLMADSHGEIIGKMECWSALDARLQVATGVAHPPPGTGDGPRAMPTFDLRTSTWLREADGASLPAAPPGTDGADAFSWKAAIMIWGGPALTLGCVYLLAAHLGWL